MPMSGYEMRYRSPLGSALLLGALALAVSACGGGDSGDLRRGSTPATTKAESPEKAQPSVEQPSVELVDSGVGQSGQYVQGIVIATTNNPESVGEHVTTSVKFIDQAGRTIRTDVQVDSFAWEGQQLVLPVFASLDDPESTVASIDASVSISDYVSDYDSPQKSRPELPVLDSESFSENPDGGGELAAFTFTNPTDEDLSGLRIGVVCYDATGKIIGGGVDYPNLAAAGKSMRIDANVTTGVAPSSCRAFPSYGY